MPVFEMTSSSSANPPDCTVGLELSREISTYPTTGRPHSYRMLIRVTDWNNITPNIFVYQRRGPDATSGDFRDTFEAVASPTDIEEYPINNPEAGEVPQLYRLSEVDLIDRNRDRLEEVWQAIQEDVEELIRTCVSLCELEDGEVVRFGEFPEDAVVDPPVVIPPGSSTPGPPPVSCPVDPVECLEVVASDDADFPVGAIFIDTGSSPVAPDCEREWTALADITPSLALILRTSLVYNDFDLVLDDGVVVTNVDSGNIAADYSAILNYEKSLGEFHSIQIAIGTACSSSSL